MDTGWKLILHLLVLVLVFVGMVLLFRSVATPPVAIGIAAVLTLGEIAVLIGTGKHGGGLRLLVAIGWPLLAFPAVGWLIREVFHADWYITIPVAAAIACALGALGARHGSGRDTRRLAEAFVAVLVPLYALIVLVVDGAPLAGLALGIGAAAVAPITTKVAVTWPGKHENALVYASATCAVYAALIGVAALM